MASKIYDLSGKKIFVAGHNGMVGSAIVRALAGHNVTLITAPRADLDLRDQAAVRRFLQSERPDVVVDAAARVGGIMANASYPADFIYDNLAIELSLIDGAHRSNVEKLLFLGSSCVYPKHAPQPMREDVLLTGPLEPTNEWYAIAKIAGLKMCEAYRRQHGRDFISAMPTNLYGLNDNFDLDSSHVLPALIRKFHQAKLAQAPSVALWGTGTPRREFLNVDDLAAACVFLLEHYSRDEIINVGCGSDLTIAELAGTVAGIVGYKGTIAWDVTKPDGTPRKLLDVSRITALGWKPRIGLEAGIAQTYRWYLQQDAAGRLAPSRSPGQAPAPNT